MNFNDDLRLDTFAWRLPARSFLPFFVGLRAFFAIYSPLGCELEPRDGLPRSHGSPFSTKLSASQMRR